MSNTSSLWPLLLFSLTACATAPSAEPAVAVAVASDPPAASIATQPQPDATTFAQAWPTLAGLLSSPTPEQRDGLIDPSIGVMVVDNPGAFVVLGSVSRFADLHHELPSFKTCELREAKRVPTFDCGSEAWSETGCLHVSSPKVSFASIERNMVRFIEDRQPNAEDEKRFLEVQRLESLVTDAVFHDEVTFYFGKVRGRWRLIAVDVVEPCSA